MISAMPCLPNASTSAGKAVEGDPRNRLLTPRTGQVEPATTILPLVCYISSGLFLNSRRFLEDPTGF